MESEEKRGPQQIDLDGILRARVSRKKMRLVPRVLTRMLERFVCQDELNGILRRTYPAVGSAFAEAALRDLDITLETAGEENIPAEGRFIFASNHPLGGLDGISLISVLGRRYGDEGIRFLVNDMLMNVAPLRNVFLPINKYGAQGRRAAAQIAEVYASDRQMLIFPAGLVSRLHPGGEISDLEWHKAFVAKALEYERDIIPVHFIALNRRRFYRLARLRKRLGIKVNLEQAMLPSELVHARGKKYRVVFGKPITVRQLRASGKTPTVLAAEIREYIYTLK